MVTLRHKPYGTKMSWLQQTNIDDLVGFVISEFDCTLLYLAIDPSQTNVFCLKQTQTKQLHGFFPLKFFFKNVSKNTLRSLPLLHPQQQHK